MKLAMVAVTGHDRAWHGGRLSGRGAWYMGWQWCMWREAVVHVVVEVCVRSRRRWCVRPVVEGKKIRLVCGAHY
jgi:hypothetical protein